MKDKDTHLLEEAYSKIIEGGERLPSDPHLAAQAQIGVEELGEPEDIADLSDVQDPNEVDEISRMKIVDALQDLHSSAMALVKLQRSMVERDKEEEYINALNDNIITQEVIGLTKDLEKTFNNLTSTTEDNDIRPSMPPVMKFDDEGNIKDYQDYRKRKDEWEARGE